MPDQNRKNRMISLRLSEEEYAALRTHYSSYGARNVSDLARLALQRVIAESPAPEPELLVKVRELDHRLNAVEDGLSFLLAREKGDGAGTLPPCPPPLSFHTQTKAVPQWRRQLK